ncbi:Fungal lipase-like domain [Trypanosoma melophagium]|uniref:Fungal lipase-like domain n=1 Tax=Trypanosoma melophagium TaxID=715481 RepID=UPI00351A3F14|nr:Fungal lipase-like domain [Trypanosoma melophagium]
MGKLAPPLLVNAKLFAKMRLATSLFRQKISCIPRDILWPCLVLTGEYIEVCVVAYRTFLHIRLRQTLRLAVAVPTAAMTLYLGCVSLAWYPEPVAALDTSSVAALPLPRTTEELLRFGRECACRYHKLCDAGETLGAATRNAFVGDMLCMMRALAAIEGTFEERTLVTASLSARESSRGVEYAASPAEEVLRIVLSISLDQGWFDIVEEARKKFELLVRERPVPPQANVASAVADLCALSYELEHCTSSEEVTITQRQRVARAVDAFRPENSVRERCTIAAEINVLPLVDLDKKTRCLMLTRRSPGRRPQLIITFVGTNSIRNWWTNFNYTTTELPVSFGMHSCVHRGYLELLESIAFEKVAMEFDQIILIGHSLGGALAQLGGLYLANARPERRVTVLTVASPRVFASNRGIWQHSRDWLLRKSNLTDKMIVLPSNCRHIRAFMCADVVPRLPPSFLGYQHVGTPLPLHTGCPTRLSFLGWGLWSYLFHSADMYKLVLERPAVAQLHYYEDVTPIPSQKEREEIA